MRVAALDVDGTLVPGALAGPLPLLLVDAGVCPRDRWVRLRQFLSCRDPEDSAVAAMSNELFASMLTDVPCRVVSEVMAELWQSRRNRVFGFVRPMVEALREAGFTPMLISGGPEEMVAYLAAELGITRFRGSTFQAEEGIYTGVWTAPAIAAKDLVASELAGADEVEWPRSLAVGNSLGDREVLARVGHRMAFEPSPALLAVALDQGWPTADRHSILASLRDQLGLRTRPAPVTSTTRRPPVDLDDAAHRLSHHIVRQVRPSGAITGNSESRVTESAMMLTLLRGERMLPAVQSSLTGYLKRQEATAEPFDKAVIDATLHGVRTPDRDRLIEHTFQGAAVHSSERKKLGLAAILAVVEPGPFRVEAPSEAFDHRLQTTFTSLRLMAIHLLNTPDPVAPELTARLFRRTEQGQRRGIIEAHLISHLFALLALHRVMPGHAVVRDGARVLAEAQRADGGMPALASEEIFVTATAGLALARLGGWETEVRAMADYLAAEQAPDGGWAFAEGVLQADTDSTAHVLSFLHSTDPHRYREQIAGALRYIRDRINPDGGVTTYLPGQPSEPTMTANAAAVLAPHTWQRSELNDRMIEFVLRAQRGDGTLERSWSLSESNAMFRACHALRATHLRNPMGHRGRLRPAILALENWLLATANTDGGWGQIPGDPSDPMSTAYSLTALAAGHRSTPIIRAGTRYLLEQQLADGSYVSRTDQAGPRPLRYSVPDLVNNFVLLAMTHLNAGAGSSPPRPPATATPAGCR